MNDKLHNKPELRERRKYLRKNLTSAEAYLWKQLKTKPFLMRKFRRQHSIGNYIVDFFCYEENLIIELDGAQHLTPNGEEYDERRTGFLESHGFTVLRFENKMILRI